jgi:hypothetical protein
MPTRRFARLGIVIAAACSGQANSATGATRDAPIVDQALPAPGVPDRGDDPAVVAMDVGGYSTCNGALIAPDVVLSSGRCVSDALPPTNCPKGASSSVRPLASIRPSIRILAGDRGEAISERASARDLLIAWDEATCRTELAFVFLDAPIDDIVPLSVRATGAARGDHLRTVGFEKGAADLIPAKLVRDHLLVLDVAASELQIGEPCLATEGGTAIDEATGEIVGIALRAGSGTCTGAASSELYARTDVFLAPIGEALSRSEFPLGSTKGKLRTKKGPIDLGANCVYGADCAAGVCVVESQRQYCSRTCESRDRCPTHCACKKSTSESWVCVEH